MTALASLEAVRVNEPASPSEPPEFAPLPFDDLTNLLFAPRGEHPASLAGFLPSLDLNARRAEGSSSAAPPPAHDNSSAAAGQLFSSTTTPAQERPGLATATGSSGPATAFPDPSAAATSTTTTTITTGGAGFAARPPKKGDGGAFAPLVSSGTPAGGIVPEYDFDQPYPAGDLARTATGADGNAPTLFSPAGVRYADGVVRLASTDLASGGFGTLWGQTRSWSNAANVATGFSGSGMVVTELPHLRQDSGGVLTAVANGFNLRYFDPDGSGGYIARFWVQDTLAANSSASEYVQTDSAGAQIRYHDFSSGPARQ